MNTPLTLLNRLNRHGRCRVQFFSGSCLAFVTILVAPAIAVESTATRPPNIILIVADDLGYAELGCYGQKWIKTPYIDAMAKIGIQFTQHYSGQAVCAPSRCSLMTGLHQGHAYIRDNGNPGERIKKSNRPSDPLYFPGQNPIPDDQVTIAEILQAKGYATAAIGKWGLGYVGSSGDPNKQGFDLFYGYNCQIHAHNHYPRFLWRNNHQELLPGNDRKLDGETYSQDKFTEVALEFIDSNQAKPFFLYLPFVIPHLAIQAPEESVAAYRDLIPEEDYEHRGYIKHPTPRAGYAAMITHLDRDIGKIVQRIEQLGLANDTIMFFTSDNGPAPNRLGGTDSKFFQSTGELRGYKGSLYEGGIRVPLVASWPGQIKPGTVSSHQSAFWDFLPTICELVGADTPGGIDGISFAPTLLARGNQRDHEVLYWEFPGYGGQQALRMGQWKAIRTNLMKKPDNQIQLYDLSLDIGETNDVAADHPELVDKMAALMRGARRPSGLFKFPALDQ